MIAHTFGMDPAFVEAVQPFVDAGIVTHDEARAVDAIVEQFAPGSDLSVRLALALAIRAPRQGHVGVPLDQARVMIEREVARDEARSADLSGLSWPEPAAWHGAIAAESRIVGEGCLFELAHGQLFIGRQARDQRDLAAALLARIAPADTGDWIAQASPEAKRAALASIFQGFGTLDASGAYKQALAAAVVLSQRMCVITGGPGTGKTTTVKRILAALDALARAEAVQPPRVALAAPTGKAAARMREALSAGLDDMVASGEIPESAADWIRSMEPTTIHRMLGSQPYKPSEPFRHHKGKPLEADLVLIDEASMIDLALFRQLVAALKPSARLILLGDPQQLSSVDAGTVLADVTSVTGGQEMRIPPALHASLSALSAPYDPAHVDADAPTICGAVVRLTHTFRTADGSPIQDFAAAIAAGDARAALAQLEAGHPDLQWIQDGADALSPELVRELASGWTGRPRLQPPTDLSDDSVLDYLRTLERYRIFAPMRHHDRGLHELNQRVSQTLLGTLSATAPGRAVMITRNRRDLGVANGDVGAVFRRGEHDFVALSALDGDRPYVRWLPLVQFTELETAFVMTVHKSQGSEYGRVALVLPASDAGWLSRELIYTAVTRTRKSVCVVGTRDVIEAAIRRGVERASTLGQALYAG